MRSDERWTGNIYKLFISFLQDGRFIDTSGLAWYEWTGLGRSVLMLNIITFTILRSDNSLERNKNSWKNPADLIYLSLWSTFLAWYTLHHQINGFSQKILHPKIAFRCLSIFYMSKAAVTKKPPYTRPFWATKFLKQLWKARVNLVEYLVQLCWKLVGEIYFV